MTKPLTQEKMFTGHEQVKRQHWQVARGMQSKVIRPSFHAHYTGIYFSSENLRYWQENGDWDLHTRLGEIKTGIHFWETDTMVCLKIKNVVSFWHSKS